MTTPDPASAHDATVFEAVLHPHRSLSPYGFRLLLIGVGLCSTILSVHFFLLGAWPVIGFFGLDIGAHAASVSTADGSMAARRSDSCCRSSMIWRCASMLRSMTSRACAT